jgi:preprotein translocase subunit SecF
LALLNRLYKKDNALEAHAPRNKAIMTEQKSWYDRWYRLMLFAPVALLIVCLIYMAFFFYQHNDIMFKDVSLSGGTTITLNGDIPQNLESDLKAKIPDANFRKLTELNSGKPIATIVESSVQPQELKSDLEAILGYNLTDENSSTEFTGPTLSSSFYKELMKTVLLAFILMGLVIFLIFGESLRIKAISLALSLSAIELTFSIYSFIGVLVLIFGSGALIFSFVKSKTKKDLIYPAAATILFIIFYIFPFYYFIFLILAILLVTYLIESIPSIAVIFAAFADIVFALTVVNIMGISLSAAGVAAFLMLIGYSVDTDILLTTRALRKREGTLNERIYGAFKTGIFMTITGLVAVLPAFYIVTGLPDSFRQIFLILAVGLFADIINTWLTNASIIKWYCERKGIK